MYRSERFQLKPCILKNIGTKFYAKWLIWPKISMCIAILLVILTHQARAALAQDKPICQPSNCSPQEVLFSPDSATAPSQKISGCIAYINASDEELRGGNAQIVSFFKPFRDIPYIGWYIDSFMVVEAEKWAVEIVKAHEGQQTYQDAALVILKDAANDAIAKTGGEIYKQLPQLKDIQSKSLKEVSSDYVLEPILGKISDEIESHAGEWIKYYQDIQSWRYAKLPHCIDTDGLYSGKTPFCYPNYTAFLQEYPKVFDYVQKSEVLECKQENEVAQQHSEDNIKGKIFFISGPTELGAHKLNIMNPDGSGRTAILPSLNAYTISYLPVFSPSGDLIIQNSGSDSIEVLDLNGNQLKNLHAPAHSANPLSWSSDGKQILLSVGAQEESEIYKLDYVSGRFTQLTNDNAKNFFATWSPDGTQIAYMSDYQLWLMDADGNHKRKLIEQEARKVAWSPDGKLIALESSLSGDMRDFDIWVVNVDGTNLRNLTHTVGLIEFDPVWSLDSTQVAYEASQLNGDSQIYVVDLVSGEKHQLTEAGDNAVVAWTKNSEPQSLASDSQLDVKPLSRKLAFVKNGNIWSIQEDGSGLAKLTSLESGEFPTVPYTWSPTGREIAYIVKGDVYILDIVTWKQRQITTNAGAEELDWHDSQIAVVRDVDDSPVGRNIRIAYINIDKTPLKLIDVSPKLTIISPRFSLDIRVRWSPDGKWIAMSYSGLAGGIAAVDGSTFINDIGVNPTWEHLSSHLLYFKSIEGGPSNDYEIWSIDPVTQKRTQIGGAMGDYFAPYADYSPDDQFMVYSAPYLKRIKRDNTNPISLFEDRALNPTWSPQGDALVFLKWSPGESTLPTSGSVYVVNADGTNLHLLVSDLAINPTWQPIPNVKVMPDQAIKSTVTVESPKTYNLNDQTQTVTATSTPQPTGSKLTAYVDADTLNVRSGPSTSYPVIGQVKKGISLTIQGRNSDTSWLQVCCVNGQPGWLINNPDYVRVEGAISALPIAQSKSEEAEPTAKPNTSSSQSCEASVDSNFAVLYNRTSTAAGCPSAQAFLTKMAYQQFQHGFMIWRPGPTGDAGGQIYVIYNSGQWKSFNDKWAAGMPVSSGYTVPNGLYEPIQGFGLLWRTQLGGPNGTIGWALGHEKGSDNGRIQAFTNGSIILHFPDQAPILLLATGKWLR